MFGSVDQGSPFGIVLTIIPPIVTLFLILSPAVTVREIIQAKSVKEFSFAPFTLMIIATTMWSTYFLYDKEYMGLAINIVGFILSILYALSYCVFHENVYDLKYYFLLILLAFVTILCLAVVPYDGDVKVNVLGYSATTVHLCFMSSPLVVMKHVIETKSVASMPFAFSFACFLNAVAWTIYGYLVTAAIPIIISNGPSALVTLTQLLLHAIYGKYSLCKCKCNTAEEDLYVEKKAENIIDETKEKKDVNIA